MGDQRLFNSQRGNKTGGGLFASLIRYLSQEGKIFTTGFSGTQEANITKVNLRPPP